MVKDLLYIVYASQILPFPKETGNVKSKAFTTKLLNLYRANTMVLCCMGLITGVRYGMCLGV